MILADKIIDLRKKAGWSQEELAEKLAVTRQSVSKWEGAQSIPDMDKVVQMSRLFGVTTDYLLKDEIEIAEPTVNADDRQPPLRRVTIGEASDYLALRRAAAPRIALATMLCIFSPIALIGLAAVSELSASAFPLREETAAGIRVLYGGSAKPENIAGFLEKEDVDGALVGGASLKADSFSAMIEKSA